MKSLTIQKRLTGMVCGATFMMIGLQANAMPIIDSGSEIHFFGFDAVEYINAAGNSTTVGVATGLKPLSEVDITLANGSFGATGLNVIPFVDTALMETFQFNPLPGPVTLWTVKTGNGDVVSFTLQDIVSIDQVDSKEKGKSSLAFMGTGVLMAAGFADTRAEFVFLGGESMFVAHTVSKGIAAVADGGTTVLLLGAALVGLGLMDKKRFSVAG